MEPRGWMKRMARQTLVVLLTSGLMACGDHEDLRLSAAGENCTRTTDCEGGLQCVNRVCVEDSQTDTTSPTDGTSPSAEETWTDPATGLTWQVTPTGGIMNWALATAHCQDLVLDGSGWRLPTIGELRTLIRGCPATQAGGSCNVEEKDCLAEACRADSCQGCSIGEGPADGGMYWPDEVEGECCFYWSSSPVEDDPTDAWYVVFYVGHVHNGGVNGRYHVRCVR